MSSCFDVGEDMDRLKDFLKLLKIPKIFGWTLTETLRVFCNYFEVKTKGTMESLSALQVSIMFIPRLVNSRGMVKIGQGSYGKVYKKNNTVYKYMPIVDDNIFLFLEIFIGIVMHYAGKTTGLFRAPEIRRVSQNKGWCIVEMEPISGTVIYRLNDFKTQKKALIKACDALSYLQSDLGFCHRDLHSGNVMYDTDTDDLWFLDFGESCMHLGDFYFVLPAHSSYSRFQFETNVRTRACDNKSIDICMLITAISLLWEWLKPLRENIFHIYEIALTSDESLEIYKILDDELPDPVHDTKRLTYIPHFRPAWRGLSHYHQLYRLFEVDVDDELSPEQIKKYLEAILMY